MTAVNEGESYALGCRRSGPKSISQVGLLRRHLPNSKHTRINLVLPEWGDSCPGPGGPTHLKLFFISRSLVMMATGSVSPVAFWISGSYPNVNRRGYEPLWEFLTCGLINTLCRFSSPMVNLPWVSLPSWAKASSALTASLWRTDRPNLTLDLVYSWPGFGRN